MNVYADYNATTPVAPEVLQYMLPYFAEKFGNAASNAHAYGWAAAEAVELARERVAEFINAEKKEIVFTSGATEAINLAIKGIAESYAGKGKHIITVATEHKAVLDVCIRLTQYGYEITYLNVDREGMIDLTELKQSISDSTILVCIMMANNETGVIQDITSVSKIVHEKKSLLFCDATQAAGKIRIDVEESGIDLLSLSAHKFYGPKGVGALYVRRKNPRVVITPLIDGGGHENGLRSGTLNVPGIAGMGKACELAQSLMWDDSSRVSKLRTVFEQSLTLLPGIFINGNIRSRIPNTTNLCFQGNESDILLHALRNVAASSGSACSSALMQPSHVLKAMGLSYHDAHASVRFSFGRYTTEAEIHFAIEKIKSYLSSKS